MEGEGDVEITGPGGLLTAGDLSATEGEYVDVTGTPAVAMLQLFRSIAAVAKIE